MTQNTSSRTASASRSAAYGTSFETVLETPSQNAGLKKSFLRGMLMTSVMAMTAMSAFFGYTKQQQTKQAKHDAVVTFVKANYADVDSVTMEHLADQLDTAKTTAALKAGITRELGAPQEAETLIKGRVTNPKFYGPLILNGIRDTATALAPDTLASGYESITGKKIKINDHYGNRKRHPVTGKKNVMHHGVDIKAAKGDTLFAPTDDMIVTRTRAPLFAKKKSKTQRSLIGTVSLRDNKNDIDVSLMHVVPLVSEGDTVDQGEPFAVIGRKDIFSTDAHGHVEVKHAGKEINPEELVVHGHFTVRDKHMKKIHPFLQHILNDIAMGTKAPADFYKTVSYAKQQKVGNMKKLTWDYTRLQQIVEKQGLIAAKDTAQNDYLANQIAAQAAMENLAALTDNGTSALHTAGIGDGLDLTSLLTSTSEKASVYKPTHFFGAKAMPKAPAPIITKTGKKHKSRDEKVNQEFLRAALLSSPKMAAFTQRGMDPRIVASAILFLAEEKESGLDPDAKNPESSAKGLFQTTRGTEIAYSRAYGLPLPDRKNLKAPEQMINAADLVLVMAAESITVMRAGISKIEKAHKMKILNQTIGIQVDNKIKHVKLDNIALILLAHQGVGSALDQTARMAADNGVLIAKNSAAKTLQDFGSYVRSADNFKKKDADPQWLAVVEAIRNPDDYAVAGVAAMPAQIMPAPEGDTIIARDDTAYGDSVDRIDVYALLPGTPIVEKAPDKEPEKKLNYFIPFGATRGAREDHQKKISKATNPDIGGSPDDVTEAFAQNKDDVFTAKQQEKLLGQEITLSFVDKDTHEKRTEKVVITDTFLQTAVDVYGKEAAHVLNMRLGKEKKRGQTAFGENSKLCQHMGGIDAKIIPLQHDAMVSRTQTPFVSFA